MLTTSLLSLVLEAPEALSLEDEALSVVDEVESVVDVLAAASVLAEDVASTVVPLESVAISDDGGGGGGGGIIVASVSLDVASFEAEALLPVVVSVEVAAEEALKGGGGGIIAMSASSDVVPLEAEALLSVVVSVELAADEASEDGGESGFMVPSVPPICSCSDRSADCMSLPSAEKALLDDTVLAVEPLS